MFKQQDLAAIPPLPDEPLTGGLASAVCVVAASRKSVRSVLRRCARERAAVLPTRRLRDIARHGPTVTGGRPAGRTFPRAL